MTAKKYIDELRMVIRMHEIALSENATVDVLDSIKEHAERLAEQIQEHSQIREKDGSR